MATRAKSAAVSHVGKIRSNNQDSGYAGAHLFIVADGMGGHAGGDVASALAIKHVTSVDRPFSSSSEAEVALHGALISANSVLAETVFDHSELTGMGTTVSGFVVVGSELAIAHIGDSRIYRLRDGALTQITSDHTFVQRLVDSGRITVEEAAVHPRRSVLMRVLGDVDATPEIDTMVEKAEPGDRWLLCSDGLSSYVAEDRIASALTGDGDAEEVAERLIKESLDQGAPDNVTVVVVDIDGSGDSAHHPAVTVGSAAGPLAFEGDVARKPLRIPTLLLHPLKATKPDDSHFEPESQEFLDELIIEDGKRAKRRRITAIVLVALLVAFLATAAIVGYQWTQTHYFVSSSDNTVAIYRGIQQDLGPISLSSVYRDTDIVVTDLSAINQKRLDDTISADSLADAERIVSQLADDSAE
jgi:serine/threonine protein phosphatase PrpC